jgi:hypothetical protein
MTRVASSSWIHGASSGDKRLEFSLAPDLHEGVSVHLRGAGIAPGHLRPNSGGSGFFPRRQKLS